MKKPLYKMRSKVWLYLSMATWHFVTLPKKQSKEIKNLFGPSLSRGWGSIRVTAKVGQTSWKTSIFPDKKLDAYLLPIKAAVRKKENITNEQMLAYSIEIIMD